MLQLLDVGTIFKNKSTGLWLKVTAHAPDQYGRLVEKVEPCDAPEEPIRAKIVKDRVPKVERATFKWPKRIAAKTTLRATIKLPRRTVAQKTRKSTRKTPKPGVPTWKKVAALTGLSAAGGLALAGWPLTAGAGLLATCYAVGRSKHRRQSPHK